MSTLKIISDELAGVLNEPFNEMLKARLKSSLKHVLVTLLRQEINKNGLSDVYSPTFRVGVSKSTLFGSNLSNDLYVTNNKIAKPINYITDDPFMYVGYKDGVYPFIYSKLAELQYSSLLPMNVNGETRYIYNNGYLYIYNLSSTIIANISSFELEIRGAYAINDIITPENKLNNITFTDDTELTFPEHLLITAKEMLLKLDFGIIRNVHIVKDVTTDNV